MLRDLFLFFFKQKTAYEMRISDWSSDVCSSDLLTLRCTQVLVPDKREHMAETSVRHFIRDHHLDTDGVLIFCPFRGGRAIGVFSVAAHLSRTLPDIDVRFYCGGESPWEDYAIYNKQIGRATCRRRGCQSV